MRSAALIDACKKRHGDATAARAFVSQG